MKIVIDIPKERYNRIISHTEGIYDMTSLLTIIEGGTPLPKGHGRLIDADMFLARNAYFADKDFIDSKYGDTLKDLIDNSPTIIEVDKEETQ